MPDKIYINKHLLRRGMMYKAQDPPAPEFEYIRKDALLEWAKEHKRVIETHGDERDAYSRGEYSALNSLIDKLNSI